VLAQPWVDALGVVKVKAHGQQLHHLPELEGAELHRARRHFLAGGVHHFSLQRPVVRELRREARRRAGESRSVVQAGAVQLCSPSESRRGDRRC